MNGRLVFTGIEEAAGVIVIEFKFAAAAVIPSVAVPLTVPLLAVMLTVPAAMPLAIPLSLMETIVASDELQAAELVTSEVVPSE